MPAPESKLVRYATSAAAFLICFIVVSGIVSGLRRATSAPTTAQGRAVQSVMGGLSSDETRAIMAYLANRGIKNDDSARVEFAGLASRGMLRLDDATLKARAQWVGALLPRLSDSDCARFIRQGYGSLPADAIDRGLLGDSASTDQVTRYGVRAALAEIRQTPPPRRVTEEEAREAVASFNDLLGRQEAARVWDFVAKPNAASDQEACYAAKLLYGAVDRLPEPYASSWARILASS